MNAYAATIDGKLIINTVNHSREAVILHMCGLLEVTREAFFRRGYAVVLVAVVISEDDRISGLDDIS
ncbi:hypothetical protein UFOVP124_9 [uncultured Caudovirales phage]|uniref:Uncharacterized protein n=1 Tax=uncultured Caudovirales phage TaxID=2100421 RepID=A0A6J5L946_9CAUD|nr:hypothetical protein UFOVP124_9 [uncultured Caudovirales phage]